MRVSKIKPVNIADYLRLDYKDLSRAEKAELKTLLDTAKAYIKSYTGLASEEVDDHEEFVIVVYTGVQLRRYSKRYTTAWQGR